jgi:hypothetical protein
VSGAAGADEECERELEKEQEEEEEQEVQVPAVQPAVERDWQYAAALSAGSVQQLVTSGGLRPVQVLQQAARLLEPASIGDISWSSKVYATHNYLCTTAQAAADKATQRGLLNAYLRPADNLLLLPTGEVLLLSEREVEGLLELGSSCRGTAAASSSARPPLLLNLCYALEARRSGGPLRLAVPLGRRGSSSSSSSSGAAPAPQLAPGELLSLHLFNGGTSYSERDRQVLAGAVSGCREAAEALVALRGLLPLFPRSDLERACG